MQFIKFWTKTFFCQRVGTPWPRVSPKVSPDKPSGLCSSALSGIHVQRGASAWRSDISMFIPEHQSPLAAGLQGDGARRMLATLGSPPEGTCQGWSLSQLRVPSHDGHTQEDTQGAQLGPGRALGPEGRRRGCKL